MSDNYEPRGMVFYDAASERDMMIVADNEPRTEMRGWILYRHPDGQWVTLLKATDADRRAIGDALARFQDAIKTVCRLGGAG